MKLAEWKLGVGDRLLVFPSQKKKALPVANELCHHFFDVKE